MEFEKRKLARQAEKLERKLKKKGDLGRRRPDETPEPRASRTRIIDATFPLEKRPSLAEIEGGRKKKSEPSRAWRGCGWRIPSFRSSIFSIPSMTRAAARRITMNCAPCKESIIETLAHFGIKAKAGDITRGPPSRALKSIPTAACAWIASRVSSATSRGQPARSESTSWRQSLARTPSESRSPTQAR